MTTEPDFFVKQGDFQSLAAGRPMLYYRDPSKALVDWEAGWRDYFMTTFPGIRRGDRRRRRVDGRDGRGRA